MSFHSTALHGRHRGYSSHQKGYQHALAPLQLKPIKIPNFPQLALLSELNVPAPFFADFLKFYRYAGEGRVLALSLYVEDIREF